MKVTVDVAALYQALDRKRVDDDLSWRALASYLEMSSSLFTLMKQGRKPSLEAFATIVTYIEGDAEAYFVW